MLGITLGVDIYSDRGFGFRGGVGATPLNIKTINYSAVVYHKMKKGGKNFSYSLEAGMPIAYFDLLEDRYVDWDKNIDSPYAGWLFGSSLNGEFFNTFFLKTGVAYWIEWQEDDGFKNGILPVISIGLNF